MASRNVIIVLVLILSSITTMAQKDFRWENRIIYLQSPSFDLVNAQLDQFKNRSAELDERKMIIFVKVGNSVYEGLKLKETTLPTSLKRIDQAYFFTLIGLDGGVKIQENEVVAFSKLRNTVDAMPMRQSELRSQEN
ncbi:protein of unknown function [Spirosomataceae bacterium TFI 002]|nr:protein of unknown function [Spirosomataceae bacterium TFI 002]